MTAADESPQPEAFGSRYLVVGEGEADAQFIGAIVRDGIERLKDVRFDRFQIVRAAGGNTKFEQRLNRMEAGRGFGAVPGLLLVTDNNGDPPARFAQVAAQVSVAAKGSLIAPAVAWKLGAKPPNRPPVAIVTLPEIGVAGTLESLILKPMQDQWPERGKAVEEMHIKLGRYGSNILHSPIA